MGYVSKVTTQRNTLIETPWQTGKCYYGIYIAGAGTYTIFCQNIDFTDINTLYFCGVASDAAGANHDLKCVIGTTEKSSDTIDAAPKNFFNLIDCSAITGAEDLKINVVTAGAINADSYGEFTLWGTIA